MNQEQPIRAAELHRRIGQRWDEVLNRLGVNSSFLTGKHGPCPMCGGKDRWRFSNFRQHGDWTCSNCGHGDAFDLLQKLYGWRFPEAISFVDGESAIQAVRNGYECGPSAPTRSTRISRPSVGVRSLLRESVAADKVRDVVRYLERRGIWPLQEGCSLRAHPAAKYFVDGKVVGHYPALLAPVQDKYGDLITLHITWLEGGDKVQRREARKLLGAVSGRVGPAIRLGRHAGEIGVAEGIETALAASRLFGVVVWSALSAALLKRFEPPEGTDRVLVFVDRDEAGITAGRAMIAKLHCETELILPASHYSDFNDQLLATDPDRPNSLGLNGLSGEFD